MEQAPDSAQLSAVRPRRRRYASSDAKRLMLSKLKHVTEARCHRRQTGASSQPRRKRRTALVLPAVCLAMSQSCMRTCVSFSCVQTVCQAGIAEWHPGGSRSRWRAREQTYRGTKDVSWRDASYWSRTLMPNPSGAAATPSQSAASAAAAAFGHRGPLCWLGSACVFSRLWALAGST